MIKKQVFLLFLLHFAIMLHKKAECILEGIYSNLNLADDIKFKLKNYVAVKDFNLSVDIDRTPLYKILDLDDFKTQQKIRRLLMDYELLPVNIQKIILSCKLSTKKLNERCNKKYPEGCDVVHPFAVSKKCPKGYKNERFSNCFLECPTGYQEVPNYPQVCEKRTKSDRSGKISLNLPTSKVSYRQFIEISKCPKNFLEIQTDICIRVCPIGWMDLGSYCLKPGVATKRNELFFYQFEEDDQE